jgi:transposase InsO family protein
MAHASAKLTVFGRQLLITRVLGEGWPVAHVADQLGISRATGYKWVRRYRAEGKTGLLDRSSRPARSPRRLSAAAEAEILAAREKTRYGPDRLGPLLGRPRSTVHRVLARRGFNRLHDADRVTTAPVRYVACHPGALVHQDHKKLGRIPDGGGHRVLGRVAGPKIGRGTTGYDHIEVVIDDHSRFGVVVDVPDESASSAAQALEIAAAEFAKHGIAIERVMTDNGWAYTHGPRYAGVIAGLSARHKRTRPYRPQTNGKAERFIQTLLNEWAYGRPYQSNQERRDALPVFVDSYNSSRPHTALGGRSPIDVVNNVRGDHS